MVGVAVMVAVGEMVGVSVGNSVAVADGEAVAVLVGVIVAVAVGVGSSQVTVRQALVTVGSAVSRARTERTAGSRAERSRRDENGVPGPVQSAENQRVTWALLLVST